MLIFILCKFRFSFCASAAASEFVSGSRLGLMYVSLTVSIRSGFQQLLLLS